MSALTHWPLAERRAAGRAPLHCRWQTRLLGAAAGLFAVLCASPAFAQVNVVVGTSGGAPGSTVSLPFVIQADSNIVALQFDVQFDPARFASQAAVAGSDATNHLADSEPQPAGTRRVILYSTTNAPLNDGIVVAAPFTIALDAPDGFYPVSLTNVIFSNGSGERVRLSHGVTGYLVVGTNSPPAWLHFPEFTGGRARFILTGLPEADYRIEASTNLTDWTSLSTNLAHGGAVFFSDLEAGIFPCRSYRAREQW